MIRKHSIVMAVQPSKFFFFAGQLILSCRGLTALCCIIQCLGDGATAHGALNVEWKNVLFLLVFKSSHLFVFVRTKVLGVYKLTVVS